MCILQLCLIDNLQYFHAYVFDYSNKPVNVAHFTEIAINDTLKWCFYCLD